ncbi:hypothetical protein AAG906_000576 [Vitis piasezkii]
MIFSSEKHRGKERRWVASLFTLFLLAKFSAFQAHAGNEVRDPILKPSSPFSLALETLQKQIGIKHSGCQIETSVSLQYLKKDIEASAKDLNRRISEISQVESSCAVDAMRLGLQKVIRVSPKTNASTPAVVCGAFRAIFGAIAMDTGKSDDAGKVFWSVHGSEVGGAAAL